MKHKATPQDIEAAGESNAKHAIWRQESDCYKRMNQGERDVHNFVSGFHQGVDYAIQHYNLVQEQESDGYKDFDCSGFHGKEF